MEIRTKGHAILTAIICASSGWTMAGPFVAPNEGPVPFRRDRLPLEASTMVGLASHLATLAVAQPRSTPEGRRASAQMAALALALDPTDESLKSLVGRLRGPSNAGGGARDAEKARARVWQIIAWVGSPEAGADGQALADCLRDVIVASDPEHPRAPELRSKGQTGAWSGWVEDVKAFQDEPVTPAPEAAVTTPPTMPVTATKPVLASTTISTPLWLLTGPGTPVSPEASKLAAAQIRLTATPDSEPLEFIFAPGNGNETLAQVGRNLSKAFGTLPTGAKWSGRLSYACGDDYDPLKNGDSVSAAAAVLANAAFTGQQPVGFVLGSITEEGKFLKTAYPWDKIRSLGKDRSGRLVIPAEAATFLPDILAIEDPEFFFRYEVLAAADLSELVDRSSGSPSPAVAEASRKFEEVRSKVGTQAVAAYVANRFVRQRLMEIALEAPFHWSARMLAIQGAGERPVKLSRVTLAYELRTAMIPATPLFRSIATAGAIVSPHTASEVDRIYEACRAEVDRIERYVDSTDRDLFSKSRDLCTSIRSYGRTLRLEGYQPMSDTTYKAYAALQAQLAAVTSEVPNP